MRHQPARFTPLLRRASTDDRRNGRFNDGQPELGRDCVAHARMFFNSRDLDLARAEPGSFSMMPTDAMIADLRRDYGAWLA